jgi:glycosyltransferase involved in cell wall biosynthesis
VKILYVVTGLGPGGAEKIVCNLADKMYEKGCEIKIVYFYGNIVSKPFYHDIEITKINLENIFNFPKFFIRFSKFIKSYDPDVIHSHMVHANLFTRFVRLYTPIKKLICTAHNSNEGGKCRMFLYRISHRLSDITTNVSYEATKAFENKKAVPIGGMKTIYNGIDIEKFKFIPEARNIFLNEFNIDKKTKILLAVGRLNEQKDYPNLLNAIYLLKKNTNIKFKLFIVGEGHLYNEIQELIYRLNLHNDIFMLGRRNDIPYLMSAADLFILSSKWEGFGLVVGEAMACKCLVIATDCGGVAEVVGNPKFLVPPSNSYKLYEKITYFLNLNFSNIELLKYNNRQRIVENFSFNKILNEWEIIYNG